jgi:hypothetical protein
VVHEVENFLDYSRDKYNDATKKQNTYYMHLSTVGKDPQENSCQVTTKPHAKLY